MKLSVAGKHLWNPLILNGNRPRLRLISNVQITDNGAKHFTNKFHLSMYTLLCQIHECVVNVCKISHVAVRKNAASVWGLARDQHDLQPRSDGRGTFEIA